MFGPQSYKLLSGIATGADGDGDWFWIGNWRPPFSVVASGLVSGDKVQIWLSDNPPDVAPTSYDAASNAIQLGSDITTDGKTAVTETYGWISIRKTAHAGGGAIVVRAAAITV